MFLNLHLLAPNCFLSPVHWCPLDRCSPLLLCPFSARFNPSRSAPHVSFTPFAHMSPPCAATSSPSCWLYIYYHVSRFIGKKRANAQMDTCLGLGTEFACEGLRQMRLPRTRLGTYSLEFPETRHGADKARDFRPFHCWQHTNTSVSCVSRNFNSSIFFFSLCFCASFG